jgi:hypothetical protein
MGLRPVNHLTLSSVLRRRASARAQLRPTLKRIDLYVIRWVRRKFKRLRRKPKGARDWFDRLRRVNPTLFTHWQLCHGNGRTSEPYESRGSRTDLGAPGVETPLGDSTLPAGLIRAARAIVGGAKAVTRPKPVEQSTRICLSIYRGTAATLGFAIPPVSSPWAHDVLK